jgi:hypothetical protein
MCSDVVMYYWEKVVEATNALPGMISGEQDPNVAIIN